MTPQPGPLPPLSITIVTGFLGAGKTTLLNRLLREPSLADTLVIVNEFGPVGLDHLLMESARDDMVLLAAGCLCCTVRGDLVATLEDLLRRRDNDRIAPFARVIIETTGLADPAPVMNAVLGHPYLKLRYRLDGVVTVVDAVNGAATIAAHREAMRQVAVADRLVVTKTDLAGRTGTQPLHHELRRLNPTAEIVDASSAAMTADLLVGIGPYDIAGKSPDVARWLGLDQTSRHGHGDHGHDHHGHDRHEHGDHGHGHHGHDRSRHSETIRAFTIQADQPLRQDALDRFLARLQAAHGARLLRLKGLIALADDPDRPLLVHAVQHVLHPPARLAAWPDTDRTTRLVFILDGLDEAFVRDLWREVAG